MPWKFNHTIPFDTYPKGLHLTNILVSTNCDYCNIVYGKDEAVTCPGLDQVGVAALKTKKNLHDH